MAHLTHARAAAAELGGKHIQEHKLVYDNPRSSDQRSSSDDTAQESTHQTGSRSSGQSAGEEDANEDDDEDSSGGQDEQEDEEDDPEVFAPFHGKGKGKGKRPAFRIDPVGDDESQNDEETSSHETGLKTNRLTVNDLSSNKKRTFSNVSNTSVLFEDGEGQFPRPKMARRLSYTGGKGLLTYTSDADHETENRFDNAIESSDEEKVIEEDDDDDEDYSGVNLISDDDLDVEDLEQQEETFILDDAQDHTGSLFSAEFNDARRLSLGSYGSDDIFDLAVPLDSDLFTHDNLQDIGFGQFFEPDPVPTSPEPMSKRKFSDSSTKRVRFDDEVQVSDSSSSSSSELDGEFPDLFMEQDKLPPILHQLIEADNDTDNEEYSSGGSDHSYWDVGQEEIKNQIPRRIEDFDESSDPGSSGYETDMGDTTDEYDSDIGSDAAPKTPRKNSVLNRPSSAPVSRATSPKAFQRSGRIPPLRGVFIHKDSREAIAVTSRVTKAVTFYRPRTSITLRQPPFATYSSTTSTANNSPRTSVQHMNLSDSEMSNDVFTNPFMNSTDIMLTGIFGSAPANASYLYGGESIGPPEAFYPFVSIEQNGNIMSEGEFEDNEDYENDVNLADFMNFGSDVDATDVDQDDETDVPATPATSMVAMNGSTPAHPTPLTETPLNRRNNTSDAMLEHLDRAGVTAFRNNQNRYRDISCLPHDPDLRASVARPIRSGRSAETLISPLRKRSSMSKRIAGSPLAGVTKASGRLNSSIMKGRRGPKFGTFS